MNWIQRRKAKGTVIKVPMTKARRQFLRQIFESFDTDGGGDIDFYEFKNAVQFVAPDLPREQIMKLFKELDVDDGGTIDFDEFCSGMSNKDAEEVANNKTGHKGHHKMQNMKEVALNHQRETQLANISARNVKAKSALGSFRALFKTHSLTFPSTNEMDNEEAEVEAEAHRSFMRSRRRSGMETRKRLRQCIVGITNDMDFSKEGYLEDQDFDDVIQKPFAYQAFLVSLQKINSLNPLEPLNTDYALKILVADTSQIAARIHSRVLLPFGHDVRVAEPGEIVEDLVIDGNYDVLFIDARMLNTLSQKPIVRHLRDYEAEKMRNEVTNAEKKMDRHKSQQKRMLERMLELVDAGISPFPATYIPEDKSAQHMQKIKMKAFQEYSITTNECLDNGSVFSELTLDDTNTEISIAEHEMQSRLSPSLMNRSYIQDSKHNNSSSDPRQTRLSKAESSPQLLRMRTAQNVLRMKSSVPRSRLSFTTSDAEHSRRGIQNNSSSDSSLPSTSHQKTISSPVKLFSSPSRLILSPSTSFP